MYKYILIMVAIILLIIMWKKKIKINWKTFFKKGVKTSRGTWGTYCYCGRQGEGKTSSLIAFLHDNKNLEIYCNIKNIKGIDYTYYEGFDGLLSIKKFLDKQLPSKKQIVIVYDEIFTQLDKYSKIGKEVIDFLCQMRKRKIIFLTTCQCWAELPLTFRRFCRYEIECHIIPTPFFSVIVKSFYDAENMSWDKDLQDFVAPIIATYISKVRKQILTSYDTFEKISS